MHPCVKACVTLEFVMVQDFFYDGRNERLGILIMYIFFTV